MIVQLFKLVDGQFTWIVKYIDVPGHLIFWIQFTLAI